MGCKESQKDELWEEMDKVMQGIKGIEDMVIEWAINRHWVCVRIDYDRLYKDYGFAERAEAGERILWRMYL